MGRQKDRMFISEDQGAQSALIAATQKIETGSYWHNVYGWVDLSSSDIGLNTDKYNAFWNRLDELTEPYLD